MKVQTIAVLAVTLVAAFGITLAVIPLTSAFPENNTQVNNQGVGECLNQQVLSSFNLNGQSAATVCGNS